MTSSSGKKVSIRVGGDLSGQVVVGDRNTVSGGNGEPVTEAELARLSELFAELRGRVTGEDGGAALGKLDELEEAITAEEPDLATMEHVQGWFRRRMPGLAEAVGRLVVSPLVTRVVTTAGDDVAAEFHRRFTG
ncbi:hypothetical protein [Actinomadura rupiterrae]|uniref:hypothetical protein n=1 Tax=Actinomadura rupiterrae TaxID=559627 RepID=UPI0020A2C96F|nr:hypothetical protein [Actinomadura rupiterrae]MCP2342841.1 hypothetical protein [Actinomadura rupiterrae]